MRKALIVDDSPVDSRMAGHIVERNTDLAVLYASDGAEALCLIDNEDPDIVLTDLLMPVMNGLELVREIRASRRNVPVILMTAYGNEDIAAEALRLGAASYVPKKNLAEHLAHTIEMVLTAAGKGRPDRGIFERLTLTRSCFAIENDASLVPPILSYLQEFVVAVNLSDESEQTRVGMALEEALLNAMYHGNLEVASALREMDEGRAYYELAEARRETAPYKDRLNHISARATPREAVYAIRDEGPGFDPTSLPDPTDPANLERISGRGLLLIRTFMDEVSFNDIGNEITMVKRGSPVESREAEGGEFGLPKTAKKGNAQ